MDLAILGATLGLTENEFKDLVRVFLDSAVLDLQTFRLACQEGDSEKAAASAHSLKGASGNLGFSDIHELAKKAEAETKNNMLDACETIASKIQDKIDQIKQSIQG